MFLAEENPVLPGKDILSWIFDEPPYDLNKPVFIDAAEPSRSISNRQARTLIRQLIAGLHHAGLRKGDCVVIHSMNDILYPILVLGIIGAGGIYAGTNSAYTQFELEHHVKVVKAKFLITEPEIIDPLLIAAKAVGISTENIRVFHPLSTQKCPPGHLSWTELLQHGEEDWVRFDDLETCKTTTAARFTSSGTTGLPKAVITTHQNLIAQHEFVFSPKYHSRPYHLKNLWSLPMFHAAVGPRAHTSSLKNGETSYIMRRFDLEPYLANIEKYEITELYMVPPMIIAVVMSPLRKKYSLKSIRCGWAGAAPISKELQARMMSLLTPGATFNQVWGMTETTCVASNIRYPGHDVTGSVGKILPGLDVKIIDDDGKDVTAYDVVGEACLRGPSVVPGYFEAPEANAETFDSDGFYHSGDMVYCDSKTKLWYIVDRKKELIKVRGFQVAPPEIEAALLQHPDIVDAAVIGVQYSDFESELPRAYVVRRPGVEPDALTEEMVKEYTSGKLARYKRLDGGVRFVDSIPKNPSGKILKRILREQAKKEIASNKAKM